jgi:hypothetical protein
MRNRLLENRAKKLVYIAHNSRLKRPQLQRKRKLSSSSESESDSEHVDERNTGDAEILTDTDEEESDLEEYVKEDGNYSETEVEDCEALDVQEEESQDQETNFRSPSTSNQLHGFEMSDNE